MKTHVLKCWAEQFADVQAKRKTFEFRRNDRSFAVGDVLDLRDFSPETQLFSGASELRRITHILSSGFGLPEGYAVLSLEPVECCGRPAHDGDPCGYILECCERYRAPAAAAWQPIATAPKDGTQIIGRTTQEQVFACNWFWDDENETEGDWLEHGTDVVSPREWLAYPASTAKGCAE